MKQIIITLLICMFVYTNAFAVELLGSGIEPGGNEYVTNGDCEGTLPTMNSVAFNSSDVNPTLSTDQAHSGTQSVLLTTTTEKIWTGPYFTDGSNCGLTSGILYDVSVWVYLPTASGIADLKLIIQFNGGSRSTLDQTSVQDTWVNLTGSFTDDDVQRVMWLRIEDSVTVGTTFYANDLSVTD